MARFHLTRASLQAPVINLRSRQLPCDVVRSPSCRRALLILRILGAFLDVYNQYANSPRHRFNINFQLGCPPGVCQGQYATIQSTGLSNLRELTFHHHQDTLLTYLFGLPCCKHQLGVQVSVQEMDGGLTSVLVSSRVCAGFYNGMQIFCKSRMGCF